MVGRKEFDMLVLRVDQMDSHGTRGIGALQQMVTDLITRVADLTNQLAKHEATHVTDNLRRSDNRKYMFSAFLTIAGLLVAIITILITRGG